MDKDQNKVLSNTNIINTKNYDQFKKLKGNRPNDPAKVKRLINNMMNVGNLTAEFPIVVNEYMEVIDGQHRLEALKNLGWPVGYRVQNGLTLDTVRGINQAGSNWGWLDYTYSFTETGTPEQKDQYGRFLNLYKHFGYGYTVLSTYCGWGEKGRIKNILFTQGEMVIPNHEHTFKLLKQYQEVSKALNHQTSRFAKAMYKIMHNPEYDHKQMVNKAMMYEQEIPMQGTLEGYMRLIEHIYNRHQAEDKRVRLY